MAYVKSAINGQVIAVSARGIANGLGMTFGDSQKAPLFKQDPATGTPEIAVTRTVDPKNFKGLPAREAEEAVKVAAKMKQKASSKVENVAKAAKAEYAKMDVKLDV